MATQSMVQEEQSMERIQHKALPETLDVKPSAPAVSCFALQTDSACQCRHNHSCSEISQKTSHSHTHTASLCVSGHGLQGTEGASDDCVCTGKAEHHFLYYSFVRIIPGILFLQVKEHFPKLCKYVSGFRSQIPDTYFGGARLV